MKDVEQIQFSGILLDTMFGLILFFSLDSFLEIHNSAHFIFYLFSVIVVVHWWLVFKSADDAYGLEVNDSALDLIFSLGYVIILEYIILMSRNFSYRAATLFLLTLLVVDLIWTLVWRYAGTWATRDNTKIERMETELNSNIKIDIIALILFIILAALSLSITPALYVALFIFFYIIYIILTFKYHIIDLKIF